MLTVKEESGYEQEGYSFWRGEDLVAVALKRIWAINGNDWVVHTRLDEPEELWVINRHGINGKSKIAYLKTKEDAFAYINNKYAEPQGEQNDE